MITQVHLVTFAMVTGNGIVFMYRTVSDLVNSLQLSVNMECTSITRVFVLNKSHATCMLLFPSLCSLPVSASVMRMESNIA